MIYIRRMPTGFMKKEQTEFARKLLEDALKKEFGMTVLPEIEKTSDGKPYFRYHPEVCFNYSHSKNMAACVLASVEVGIDIERIRPFQEKTARRFCNEPEWRWLINQQNPDEAWIHIWTQKEACLKYTGTGIRTDLRKLDVSPVLRHETKKVVLSEKEIKRQGYLFSVKKENYIISVCSRERIENNILHI